VNTLLVLIIAAGVLMIFGASLALLLGGGRGEIDDRMERYVTGTAATVVVDEPTSERAPDVADRIDRVIAGRGFSDRIRARMARADVKLRVSEYITLQIISVAAVGFFAYQFFGNSIILGAVGGIVGSILPRLYVSFAARRRIRAFDGQLSDTLNLWVNALRSGYSVLQAMEAIAAELPPPVSVEFERVVQEVRLGLTLSQALANMLRRVPSEDLDLVVTAVNIQREVGGNLAEVLDTISFTIRERVRIKGEIRTLTAQGRLSGWVISLLPLVLAFVLFGINPGYMSELWVREDPIILGIPCGWMVIAGALILMAVGIYAIQRIVDIEV